MLLSIDVLHALLLCQDPETVAGVIIGTGTNMCYVDKVHDIKKLEPSEKVYASTTKVVTETLSTRFGRLVVVCALLGVGLRDGKVVDG